MTQKRTKKNLTTMSKTAKSAKRIDEKQSYFSDYQKLAKKLWKRPATKWVLGGVAVASIFPLTLRLFRRYPQINEFLSENIHAVEESVGEIGTKLKGKIDHLKGDVEDFSDGARH